MTGYLCMSTMTTYDEVLPWDDVWSKSLHVDTASWSVAVSLSHTETRTCLWEVMLHFLGISPGAVVAVRHDASDGPDRTTSELTRIRCSRAWKHTSSCWELTDSLLFRQGIFNTKVNHYRSDTSNFVNCLYANYLLTCFSRKLFFLACIVVTYCAVPRIHVPASRRPKRKQEEHGSFPRVRKVIILSLHKPIIAECEKRRDENGTFKICGVWLEMLEEKYCLSQSGVAPGTTGPPLTATTDGQQ